VGVADVVLEFIPYLGAAMMVGLLTITGLTTFPGIGHALLAPICYLAINDAAEQRAVAICLCRPASSTRSRS